MCVVRRVDDRTGSDQDQDSDKREEAAPQVRSANAPVSPPCFIPSSTSQLEKDHHSSSTSSFEGIEPTLLPDTLMTTHPALMAATSGGAGAGAAAAAASTSHSQSHLHLDAGAAISTSGGPASTSQSSSSSSYPIEPLRSPPYNASTSNNQGSSKVAAWTALPRAGCSRIIEQEEEDQLMTGGGPSTSSQGIMGAGTSPPQQRRKRARHGIKIKRNRKITSCLACRERKQKVSGGKRRLYQ